MAPQHHTFRQYTSCVSPGNFVDLGFSYLFAVGLIASISTGIVVARSGGPNAVVAIAVLIALVTVLITFCIWWLYGRLICLGGERCLIGMVTGGPSVQPLSKAGDDDASINVYLAPGPLSDDKDIDLYVNSEPLGYLLKPQDVIFNIGRGYTDELKHFRRMHCEFEGSGLRNVLAWASVILALLIALLIVPYPFNIILLWLLSVITVFSGTTALLDPWNPGDPTEDPSLGTVKNGDIVAIKGDWIYDSLHPGWNEIHAIHACQRLAEMEDPSGPWPVGLDTPDAVDKAVKA